MESERNNVDERIEGAARPSCVDLERLGRYRDGSSAEVERRAMEAHLAGCPHCRLELRLIDRFLDERLGPDEERDVDWMMKRLTSPADRSSDEASGAGAVIVTRGSRGFGGGRRTRFEKWGAVAATLLIVFSGALYWASSPSIPDFSGDGPGVLRDSAPRALSPIGEVNQAPMRLAWQGVSGAGVYDVAVLEVDRTPLWSSQLAETSVALPEEVRRQMTAGRSFLWRVVARAEDGRELGASRLESFRLTSRE